MPSLTSAQIRALSVRADNLEKILGPYFKGNIDVAVDPVISSIVSDTSGDLSTSSTSANKTVDASPESSWAEFDEAQPFGLGVNINIPDKPTPDDLATEITERERVGACLYVVKKSSSWVIEFFNNSFYLTGFSVPLKERVQILETFGSSIISFFDESVRVYSFSGTALDTLSSNPSRTYKNFHQSGLIHMYDNIIRGTKLVDNNRIAVMSVSNHYVYGYPVSLNVSYSAASDKLATFSMQWIVSDHVMNYPYVMEETDLENIYKVNSNFKKIEMIDAPLDVNKTIDNTIPVSVDTNRV